MSKRWLSPGSWIVAIGVLLSACGPSGQGTTPSNSEPIDPLFQGPNASRLEERAPGLYNLGVEAKRLYDAAKLAGDGRAADDHATEARLYIRAAETEANRIDLATRLTNASIQLEGATVPAAEANQQVAALQREAALDRGRAEIIRAEISPHLAPPGASEEDVTLTMGRARLVVKAAAEMGADASDITSVTNSLDAASDIPELDARREHINYQLRRSHHLLGTARRAREDVPSAERIHALVAAARDAGFEVDTNIMGTRITSRSLFTRRNRRVEGDSFDKMQALLTEHSEGPVQARVYHPEGSTRRAVSERRVATLERVLAEGRTESRSTVVVGGELPPGLDGRVDFLFLSYSSELLFEVAEPEPPAALDTVEPETVGEGDVLTPEQTEEQAVDAAEGELAGDLGPSAGAAPEAVTTEGVAEGEIHTPEVSAEAAEDAAEGEVVPPSDTPAEAPADGE